MKAVVLTLAIGICSSIAASAQQSDLDPPFPGNSNDSGKINSPFGPRNPGAMGSTFHPGVDYNLKPGDADVGTLIPAFVEGKIVNLVVGGGDGHVLEIDSQGQGVRLLHLGSDSPDQSGGIDVAGTRHYADVVYMMLNTQTPPTNNTKARTSVPCPYIIFLDTNNKPVHAYTRQSCARNVVATGPYAGLRSSAVVDRSSFSWLATVGSTGTQSGHLHVALNSSCPGNKCNPLSRIRHAQSPANPPYNVTLVKTDLAPSDAYLSVRIAFSPDLDLDSVRVQVPGLGNADKSWSFGGRPGASARLSDADIYKAALGECTSRPGPPLIFGTPPTVCAEPWSLLNLDAGGPQKFLVFWLPINLANVVAGTYPVTVTTTGVLQDHASTTLNVRVVEPTYYISVSSAPTGWQGLPATVEVSGMYPTSKFLFSAVGSQGNTCGTGERGGPIFSSQVDADAAFFGATIARNMPTQGEVINRKPCSTFVARKVDATGNAKIWINATARGERFSQFGSTDYEYQLRYYSGDPTKQYSDKSCLLGRVSTFGGFSGTPVQCDLRCDSTLVGKLGNNSPVCQ